MCCPTEDIASVGLLSDSKNFDELLETMKKVKFTCVNDKECKEQVSYFEHFQCNFDDPLAMEMQKSGDRHAKKCLYRNL